MLDRESQVLCKRIMMESSSKGLVSELSCFFEELSFQVEHQILDLKGRDSQFNNEDYFISYMRETVRLAKILYSKGFLFVKDGYQLVHISKPESLLSPGDWFYQFGRQDPGTLSLKFVRKDSCLENSTVEIEDYDHAGTLDYIKILQDLSTEDRLLQHIIVIDKATATTKWIRTEDILESRLKSQQVYILLFDLANDIGHEWKRLGIELSLTNAQLDHCQANNPGNAANTNYEMLSKFVQKQTQSQWQPLLIEAFRKIERTDLAEKVEDWLVTQNEGLREVTSMKQSRKKNDDLVQRYNSVLQEKDKLLKMIVSKLHQKDDDDCSLTTKKSLRHTNSDQTLPMKKLKVDPKQSVTSRDAND